jgi:hypothetical protein
MQLKINDPQGAFRAMTRVAEAQGARLTIDASCQVPCADLKTKQVVVPPVPSTATKHDFLMWRGYGYHEAGHLDSELSDMLPLVTAKRIGMSSLLGRVLNVGEDVRNEHNRYGQFPGRDEALEYIQAYFCKHGAEKIKEVGWASVPPEQQVFCKALVLSYTFRQQTFQTNVDASAFDGVVDVSEYHDLLPTMFFDTAENVYEWAVKFIERETGKSEEEQRQEAEAQYKPGKGEGDPADAGEGDEKSDGSDKPGSLSRMLDGEEGGDEDKSPVKGKISYADLIADNHAEKDDSGGFGSRMGEVSIIYDHEREDFFIPSGMVDEFKLEPSDEVDEYTDDVDRIYNECKGLSSKVKRLFQAASQRAKLGSQQQGKLDRRALARVPTGSREIWYKDTTRLDPRDTAVYLLVDGSGSMAGRDRYECATAAAMAMADSLTPLQMPVKVAIFSDDYSRVIHAVVKGWGDRHTPEQMKQRFQKFRMRGMMRNNDDGSSVLHAAKDLATRKEHRKILIVLSDGQPAASGAGDAYTYAEKVIKAVSQQVDCYGIGIQDKTVSHLYPESTCITNPSQLNDALLSVVKQKLL